MIKATIAGEQFVLQTLKDAELLLQILERAVPVASGWLDTPNLRRVLYATDREFERSVEITTGSELLTLEQFRTMQAVEAKANAEAVAAVQAVPA